MKHERLVLKDFLSCLKNLITFGHMKGVIPCHVILNIEKILQPSNFSHGKISNIENLSF